jgi:hypothetical protein
LKTKADDGTITHETFRCYAKGLGAIHNSFLAGLGGRTAATEQGEPPPHVFFAKADYSFIDPDDSAEIELAESLWRHLGG